MIYGYYSHGELVGHSGPELPPYPNAPGPQPRAFVFIPGPAFARVWPVLQALQRASVALVQELLAAQASGRLPPLPRGASPDEIRAYYGRFMDGAGTEVADERALALELHNDAGVIANARGATITELLSADPGSLPPGVHEEVARHASSLGYPGDPPYYTLMVPPES